MQSCAFLVIIFILIFFFLVLLNGVEKEQHSFCFYSQIPLPTFNSILFPNFLFFFSVLPQRAGDSHRQRSFLSHWRRPIVFQYCFKQGDRKTCFPCFFFSFFLFFFFCYCALSLYMCIVLLCYHWFCLSTFVDLEVHLKGAEPTRKKKVAWGFSCAAGFVSNFCRFISLLLLFLSFLFLLSPWYSVSFVSTRSP